MELQPNINELLIPISATQPVGEDLRLDESVDALYFQLKELRNQARQAERKQMQEAEQQFINAGDWQKFAKLAVKTLQHNSKDFEIACWLVEAWTRSDGFQGLSNGLMLLQGLLTQFWPPLYPAKDEDGLAGKLAAFASLNGGDAPGSLIVAITAQPITTGTRYAVWQYMQALEIAQIHDVEKRRLRIKQGAAELSQIQYAASQTSAGFITTSLAEVQACLSALAALENTFIELCGDEEAPIVHHIRRALQDCANVLTALQKELPVTTDAREETTEETSHKTDMSTDSTTHPAISGSMLKVVTNRNEALQRLVDVSQFFRTTEPHSPISYLLEKAVHWGQLSLPELLDELVMDRNSRFDIGRVTGAYSVHLPSQPSYQVAEQADEDDDDDYEVEDTE